jgi:hypothetical protein
MPNVTAFVTRFVTPLVTRESQHPVPSRPDPRFFGHLGSPNPVCFWSSAFGASIKIISSKQTCAR